jgi:hypothetical protein
MNFSRADSHVNCLKTSDVSETHSIFILREGDLAAQTRTVAYICCGGGPAQRSGPIGVSRRRHYVIVRDWTCFFNLLKPSGNFTYHQV